MRTDPATYARDLAAALRKQRKALRLTQIELGNYAGCGPDFIYDLEQGKPTVRLDKVMAVLEVLGLQLTLAVGRRSLAISGTLR